MYDTAEYGYDNAANTSGTWGYYRARYYDPTIGRFISEDPIGFRGGINFYRYVGNNPLKFVDPFGLKIVVNGNATDQGNYQQAINYLKRDPGMAATIQALESSSTTYTIKFNSSDDDSYDPSTNAINWDPHSALRTSCGSKQSPALGLGHEMGHANQPWYWGLVGWLPWPGYDYLEERRVITGLETNAAHTLGEGTRTDHGGTTYWVPTPTSR